MRRIRYWGRARREIHCIGKYIKFSIISDEDADGDDSEIEEKIINIINPSKYKISDYFIGKWFY